MRQVNEKINGTVRGTNIHPPTIHVVWFWNPINREQATIAAGFSLEHTMFVRANKFSSSFCLFTFYIARIIIVQITFVRITFRTNYASGICDPSKCKGTVFFHILFQNKIDIVSVYTQRACFNT
jgi:hypothetical protein